MMSSATALNQSPLRVAGLVAADIKLHHSVFALPFALLGAFMAAAPPDRTIHWNHLAGQIALIVLVMVLARTSAMLANRLLDRAFDARNPRTAQRAIPSGRLSVRAATIAAAICIAAFMGACAAFGLLFANWWPAALGLPVLAWICAYPLLKRFTALCHLWLGASLAISPPAAALAIDPAALAHQPALWLLSAMVLCWVAGFDIIYALQDVEIDRREGLHSIPARLGAPVALWISRAFHAVALACLVAAWAIDPRMGIIFAIGVGIVALLLMVEHVVIARGTSRIVLAFFTINGVISCVLGLLGAIDVLGV